MIATVTLNTALDRILFVRNFRMGRRIVAERSLTTVGGKGTVVSSLLRRMGAETRAYGFAAGPSGRVMCELLSQEGVPFEFVEAIGETRVNTVLVDLDAQDQTTVIMETLRVEAIHIERMEERIREHAAHAPIWVFSGSLPLGAPEDLWARLVTSVKAAGSRALLDTSGAGLRPGMQAGPFLIKPNWPELEEAVGRSLPSLEHVRDAAEELLAEGPEWVVVTLGGEGALAVTAGQAYVLPPQDAPVVSTSGAGDGVVAGIALALERGAEMETALRMGAAVAASVVTQAGTSQCDPADVERFFRQTRLQSLSDAEEGSGV